MRARPGVILSLAIAASSCSPQASSFTPSSMAQTSPANVPAPKAGGGFVILHSFTGGMDGSEPNSAMVALNGDLYGTTKSGGGSTACSGGCGTVFGVSASGRERVVYRFQGGPGGSEPTALLAYGDALYGVTEDGGKAARRGTVFHLTTSGALTTVYRFHGDVRSGWDPQALYAANGSLYGTTRSGGLNRNGVFFQITSSGNERVVRSFPRSQSQPRLLWLGGTFYGVRDDLGPGSPTGVIFTLDESGVESTLGYADVGALGSFVGPPVTLNGDVYAASSGGGSLKCDPGAAVALVE